MNGVKAGRKRREEEKRFFHCGKAAAGKKNAVFSRKKEKGQALTELVVILIGICFVLLGVILFSVVGVNGVQNVLAARREADHNMSEGIMKTAGKQISHWVNIEKNQGDGMQFTADDLAVSGYSADGSVFRRELVSSDGSMDISSLAAGKKSDHYTHFDFATVRLFFLAAALTSGSARINDIMSDSKLKDVHIALKKFGLSSKIDIEDTVYMPDIYSGND